MRKKKIVIVGGGASGLMCACKLIENGADAEITILEQLEDVGRKLLATGNGRCNITNLHADTQGYFGDVQLAEKVIKKFSVKNVLDVFSSMGLECTSDDEGRFYPASFQAQSVLLILKNRCETGGVNIVTNCTVNSAAKQGELFKIKTDKGDFVCDFLVLACGGLSNKGLGSTGIGYELAKGFGHKKTDCFPGLVQLKSSSKYPKKLKGTRVKAKLTIEIDDKKAASSKGEILFTDYGISGICTMQLSRYVSEALKQDPMRHCAALIDLIPSKSEQETVEYLTALKAKYFTDNILLAGLLPIKLAEIISVQAGGNIELMAKIAKNWKLIITDTLGFQNSQVTCGGIDTKDIDENMMSSKAENLFITGEMINVDGDCGGYNLQWAWASACVAANEITKRLNK